MNETAFECEFCGKQFHTETRYLKHNCEKMQRREEIKTPIGQTAFNSYQMWFRLKKKNIPDVITFLESKQYKPFIKFAEFIKRLKITEVELFIRMMNDIGILPAHWTRDEMYSQYLEYLDRKITPYKQVSITLRVIEKIVEAADCDTSEVFDVLTPSELIQLVRERKFTPWLLLKSPKFMVKFERMSDEEKKIFLSLVRIEYWKTKFQNNPDVNQYMRTLVGEMEL